MFISGNVSTTAALIIHVFVEVSKVEKTETVTLSRLTASESGSGGNDDTLV